MRARQTLNLCLLLVLLLLVGSNWALTRDATRPNFEFLPDMVRSVPSDAFASSAIFPDGKTLQPGVTGTIPRGFMPLHYGPTPQDALRAGEELVNPFTLGDGAATKRGAELFGTYCGPCHGATGRGDGIVVQRGFPAPPSLVPGRAASMQDGQLFHVITYGRARMSAYASLISREDRWKVVLHLRLLQQQAAGSAGPASQAAQSTGR